MSVYANNISKKKPTKEQRLELSYLTFISTGPFRLVYQRVWMSKQYLFFALILPWNLVTHFRNFINTNACNDYEIKPIQRRMHVFLKIHQSFWVCCLNDARHKLLMETEKGDIFTNVRKPVWLSLCCQLYIYVTSCFQLWKF